VFDLDLDSYGDFDDGVRVWDASGVVDLGPREIRAIELLPAGPIEGAPGRLHGTVRSRQGDFTGFVQWDREECVGEDELEGRSEGRELAVRFDTIRAIARDSADSSRVTLRDGRELVLSGTRETGGNNQGVYVDDPRYGRVLVSWDAFERLDLDPPGAHGSGPAYGDFPPGRPLTGTVTARDGRRLAGRLVYDLDESETTETLDAPSRGVDYTLAFGRIVAVAIPPRDAGADARAEVTLASGEALALELDGDLGERNAGLLVFVDGSERPEYVAWGEVERIDFDRSPSPGPPSGGR
jgi:hypothetical protein